MKVSLVDKTVFSVKANKLTTITYSSAGEIEVWFYYFTKEDADSLLKVLLENYKNFISIEGEKTK